MDSDLRFAIEKLKENTFKIIPEDEFEQKLIRSHQKKRPLIVKLGADPSAPDIHFGHLVVLRKLKQFQELGHKIVFIIGDFTGMIGDPTGKDTTRPRLTKNEVMANAKTYEDQVFKILDRDKTTIEFNSNWFEKLNIYEFLEITSNYTVSRMLERNDFSQRFKDNMPISLLEFLYPLVQGYDSVAIKADVELGGTDQEFNLLVGRILLQRYGHEPQIAMIMPIIEGLDGKQKMSKSLGNYIGINDEPNDMFGKIMSIPDTILPGYIKLLSDRSQKEKEECLKDMASGALNPRDLKMGFACEMVEKLHSQKDSEKAKIYFVQKFVKRDVPDEIKTITITSDNVIEAIFKMDLGFSKGEIKRLISQGGVRFNEEKIVTPDFIIDKEGILKIGKKLIFKIKIKE